MDQEYLVTFLAYIKEIRKYIPILIAKDNKKGKNGGSYAFFKCSAKKRGQKTCVIPLPTSIHPTHYDNEVGDYGNDIPLRKKLISPFLWF